MGYAPVSKVLSTYTQMEELALTQPQPQSVIHREHPQSIIHLYVNVDGSIVI